MPKDSKEASELDKDRLTYDELKRKHPNASEAELKRLLDSQESSAGDTLQQTPRVTRSAQSKTPHQRIKKIVKGEVVTELQDNSNSQLHDNSESGTHKILFEIDTIHSKDTTLTPENQSDTVPNLQETLSTNLLRKAFQALKETEKQTEEQEDFSILFHSAFSSPLLRSRRFLVSTPKPDYSKIPVPPDLTQPPPHYPPNMDKSIYKYVIEKIELGIPIILYFEPTPPEATDSNEALAIIAALQDQLKLYKPNTVLKASITQALKKIESLSEDIQNATEEIPLDYTNIFYLLHLILKQILWECTLSGTLYHQCNLSQNAENENIRKEIKAERKQTYKQASSSVMTAQNLIESEGYEPACFGKTILVTPTQRQLKQLTELLPRGDTPDFDLPLLQANPNAAAALPKTNNPSQSTDSDLKQVIVQMANMQSHSGLSTRPPKFGGNVEEYPHWFSTFSAMVDQNPNCGDSLKLLRLKECLQGEVKDKAEKYYYSADAYDRILAMIKEEWGDPEVIADALKQKIMRHDQVSMYASSKLRSLSDKVDYYYAYCKTNMPDEIQNAKHLVKTLFHKLSPQYKDRYLYYKSKHLVTEDEKTYALNELNYFRIWLLEQSDERKKAEKAYVLNPSQVRTTVQSQYSPPKKENQRTQRSNAFPKNKQTVQSTQQRQKSANQPQKRFWLRKQPIPNKPQQTKVNMQPIQRQPQDMDDKKLKNSFQSFLTNIGLDKKTALYTDAKSNTIQKPRIDVERIKKGVRNPQCILCLAGHNTQSCNKDLNPAQILYRIWTNNACANCYYHGHSVPQCKEKNNCRKCNKKHGTKVHVAIMDLAAATAEPNGKKSNHK